jgi:hypothetical protein
MRPKQWIKNLIVLAPVTFALPHHIAAASHMILISLAALAVFGRAPPAVYL